jgi:transcriptional regulator with XRE-family HTH domain
MRDDLPTLTTGQRIKLFRQRAGKTRAVLGGLVGRSDEWVKSVEMGRILPPRLPMLSQIARALKVRVEDLIDGDDSVVVQSSPGHAALPAVRDSLNRWPATDPEHTPSLDLISERLAVAWRARHAAPDHRTVIGGLLPDLIQDALSATLVHEGEDRRRAQALLADVLGLSQMFLAYQPAADLLWRVVDRAVTAAYESGDEVAIAQAVWFAAEAHRDAGDWDTAMAINLDGIRALESALPQGSEDVLGMYGALQASAAFTAARAGEAGRAWRYWDLADKVVRKVSPGYYQRVTSFSRPVMVAHAVTLEVELRRGDSAVQTATQTQARRIQSRPRRARHLIEVARGHQQKLDHRAVLNLLSTAYETAPETIRYNVYARQMVKELLQESPLVRRDAHDLAVKVGLVGQG